MNMPLVMGIVVAIGIGAAAFLFSTGFDDLSNKDHDSTTQAVTDESDVVEDWTDIDHDLDAAAKKESNEQKFANIEASIEANPNDRPRAYKFGAALIGLGEFERAERFYQRQLKLFPEDANIVYGLGWCHEKSARWEDAIKCYYQAIRMNKHKFARNNLAWVLATCPDDNLRDGFKAVAMARQAIGKDKSPKPGLLDTLAAAYAETGDFEKAVRIQKLVVRKSKDKQEVEKRLELYKSQKPFRSGQ